MKKTLLLTLAALCAPGAFAATDIGVSIGINQPGLYGRIDIGNVAAPPVLYYPQPVVIVQGPVAVQQRPIYLHVPPGHAKDWRRYCNRYAACGQPVYFVQDSWYRDQYEPAMRARRGDDQRGRGDYVKYDKGNGKGKDKDKDKDKDKGHGNGKNKD